MKRNLDIILINLIFLTVGVGLFSLNGRFEILAAIIATGISLSLGIRQYNTENDKIFKDLFAEFNNKYQEKFNASLNEIVEKTIKNNNLVLNENEEQLVNDYLNFCSEEYLWYSKNRISSKVWDAWENGMIYYFNVASINKVILKQKGQETSYYGFFEKIGKKIQNWR